MPIRRCAALAALVASLMPPAIATDRAGDESGTAAAKPGTLIVAAGSITCPDALAVVNRYLTDPSLEHDGEWVHFDGWDCWAPSPDQKAMKGFGTECSRGVDDIQIRD